MSMHRIFVQHPQSVGESYLEHQRHALTFGATMVLAGLACIVHALIPALFLSTGSRSVTRLYERMVTHRARSELKTPSAALEPIQFRQ